MIDSTEAATSHQELAVTDFTILIDTREQAPYQFTGFTTDKSSRGGQRPLIIQTRVVGLQTGDYSIEGFQDQVAVERKSLEDLYGTLGQGRERFERELERLSKMDRAAVVVEASLGLTLTSPPERSRLSPKSVFRSINAWRIDIPSIHWIFCDDKRLAERQTYWFLARWHAKRAAAVVGEVPQ